MELAAELARTSLRIPHGGYSGGGLGGGFGGRRGGGGLGHAGSFIVHAAIWRVAGQAIATIFRRVPALGTVAAILLVLFVLPALTRWGNNHRRRARSRRPPYARVGGRGPRDW